VHRCQCKQVKAARDGRVNRFFEITYSQFLLIRMRAERK